MGEIYLVVLWNKPRALTDRKYRKHLTFMKIILSDFTPFSSLAYPRERERALGNKASHVH